MADGDAPPTSKIRIKIGQIEVEYEGAHEFLKEDLPALLATVVELRQHAGVADKQEDQSGNGSGSGKGSGGKIAGTVGALAAKLDVTSGTDLIIAAAAKLTLVDNLEKFSRKALLEAMQTAAAYYKQSYSSNLSKYLKTLQEDGRLTEPSTEHYALTPSERAVLETKLAG